MSIMEMLGQSSVLALLGMATVFFFLLILVASVTLSSRIIAPDAAGKGSAPEQESGDAVRTEHIMGETSAEQERIVAAIAAAVVRTQKGKEIQS